MGWRKNEGLKRLLVRFCRAQKGTAAVEFGIVALPFIWLVCIVFETAAVLFTDIAIQNGVTSTARLIRTGQVQTQGINQASFKQLLCENIATYLDCSTKLRIEVRKFTTLPTNPSAVPDIMTTPSGTPEAFEPGGPMEWVLVRARYDWTLVVPGLSQLSNMGPGSRVRRMTSGAVFRNEPYGG